MPSPMVERCALTTPCWPVPNLAISPGIQCLGLCGRGSSVAPTSSMLAVFLAGTGAVFAVNCTVCTRRGFSVAPTTSSSRLKASRRRHSVARRSGGVPSPGAVKVSVISRCYLWRVKQPDDRALEWGVGFLTGRCVRICVLLRSGCGQASREPANLFANALGSCKYCFLFLLVLESESRARGSFLFTFTGTYYSVSESPLHNDFRLAHSSTFFPSGNASLEMKGSHTKVLPAPPVSLRTTTTRIFTPLHHGPLAVNTPLTHEKVGHHGGSSSDCRRIK